MSHCKQCNIEPIYGKRSVCKICYNAARRERYDNGAAEKIAADKKLWRKNNPQSVLVTWAKSRAKKKNIPFDITPEDVTIPECCPILGIKLEAGEKHLVDNSPSIDRIDPKLGYVKGNIQVISYRANRIKNDATLEELKKLVEHLSKK